MSWFFLEEQAVKVTKSVAASFNNKTKGPAAGRPWRVFCGAMLLALVCSPSAWGKTSAVARWADPAIAGPGISQRLALYLNYFPGDGEAVLRARLNCDGGLTMTGGQSNLGTVDLEGSDLVVEYAVPVSAAQGDTVLVEMTSTALTGRAACRAGIYTSAHTDGAAHEAFFDLAVRAPIALEAAVEPARLFPGSATEVRVALRHAGAGEALRGAQLQLPAGVEILAGETAVEWPTGLAPGQADTLTWTLRMAASGRVEVGGRADGLETAGSPLGAFALIGQNIPGALLDTEWVEVGQRAAFVYRLTNATDRAIELDAVRVEIPAAFADIEARAAGWQVRPREPEADKVGEIVLLGGGVLEPGAALAVEVDAQVLRPGPFPMRGFIVPAGYGKEVPLAQAPTLRAVWPQVENRQKTEENGRLTDLELVGQAFAHPLAEALDEIQLARGSEIFVEALEKGDKNWAVDEALARGLRERGFTVMVREPENGGAFLRYRLAEARVVYRKSRSLLNPFGGGALREATGDLFLELEAAGERSWVRRVRAYARQEGGQDELPESAAVERKVVQQENKLIERGLTLGIVSGLFFIFFAP